MSLFQKSVEKKYLSELNEAVINSKYALNPEPGFNLKKVFMEKMF